MTYGELYAKRFNLISRPRAEYGSVRDYAKAMGVIEKTVHARGGVDKLSKLSPEIQRILLRGKD
jgi:hypothetical protein